MSGLLPHRRKGFRQTAPSNFDGFGNKSRSFDGVDDYVDLGNSTDFSFSDGNTDEPFSLSTWVKMDDNSIFRMLSKDNGTGSNREWLLATDSGGNLNIYLIDGGQFRGREYTTPLPENEWLHISATYDGSGGANFRLGLKLYVNGVQVDNADFGFGGYVAMDVTTNNVYIGRYATSYADGKFADVRIYDDELTSSEVLELYNGTNITTNLIGHWLKDTDDVLDHSTNSNNGENFGSRFSPDNPSPAITFGRASRYFDGQNDYVDFGDTDDFSFGDGSNDSPFSISAWIKPNSTSEFRIFSKYNNTTNLREYTFTTDTSGRLVLLLKDPSTNANLLRRCSSNNMSNYIGQWVHVVATYDGSSNESGMKCYINAVREDDLSSSSGSYIAMENTTESAKTGTNGLSTYADGNIADLRLYDAELSTTDITSLYNGTNITTNLIGHWLTDNDDVEDKAGTNDGTNFGSTYSYDAPFPANKLIDTYASTCGAYSLRELSTTWAGQSVVDVRRASDDTVQSFTEAQISDGTLATFCGTQGGFVSKIYDQSGNGFDLIQPTAGSQPRIYVGSTQLVVTDNGKPAIDFFGTTYMYNAGSFDYEGGVSWVCVLNANLLGTSGQRIWCDDIIGTQGYLNFSPTQYNLNDGAGYASFAVTGATTNQQIRSFYFNEATANYLYRMDETESSATLGGFTQGTIEISGTSANIGLMGAGNGGQNLTALWQELVIYPNDQRHNRLNIERNVNEYYSVY